MAEPGPRQIFNSFITRIAFPRSGTWCSVSIALGNLGEGGNSTATIYNLKPGSDPPIDPIVVELGTDGQFNSTFWDVRALGVNVPDSVFKQEIELSDGKFMRAFGIGNFDGGDNHNYSVFFFKAPGASCDADVTASSTHSPPGATIYDNAEFDRFDPFSNPFLSFASGETFADHTFHFELTKDEEEVVVVA
jgi:hypothetical protein